MSHTPIGPQEQGRADLSAWRRACEANAFDSDLFLRRLLRRHLGDRYEAVAQRLRALAERTGLVLGAAVEASSRDENLPRLRRHDPLGNPVEEVVFHPAYHEAGRAFWGSGVLAVLANPGNELVCGAIAYLLDQHGEAGHACPVACTAGAIKLVQRAGSPEQKARLLPALLSDDYDRCVRASQFVTEVQGGSDVGANACTAVPEHGRLGFFRISGEKWFCSVADADLFVVSARPEGAASGTRGLGLFLVPRLVGGRPNGFRLRRLKEKLGTRSMATGEIELDGALGEAIGPLEDGFRNLVGVVLDTSRVHNALGACGAMRRAFVLGQLFARHRRAFGQPASEFPAVQAILARMKAMAYGALATTFRILALTDRLETGRGNESLAAARRIAVMINKYWTALAGTATVRDGIELLGGNGTIEDFSPLPRLYRDAMVIESWEGTHGTLCAQVLRDFSSRGMHRPWLDELRREVEVLPPGDVSDRARGLHAEVTERIDRLLAGSEATAQAHIRHVTDRMCRLTEWVALASQHAAEKAAGMEGDTDHVLALYRLLWLDRADPQEVPGLVEQQRLASL